MIEISRSSSLMIACWSIIDSSIWEILVLIRSTLSLRSVNCAFICIASSLKSKLEDEKVRPFVASSSPGRLMSASISSKFFAGI